MRDRKNSFTVRF